MILFIIIMTISPPILILANVYNRKERLVALRHKFSQYNLGHFLTLLIWASTTALYALVFLKKLNFQVSSKLLFPILSTAALSSICLFIIEYKLIQKIKNNKSIFSIVFSLIVIGATLLTDILVNNEIVAMTGVDPSLFIEGKTLLTFYLAPFVWVLIIFIITSISMLAHAGVMLSLMLYEIAPIRKFIRSSLFVLQIKAPKGKFNPLKHSAIFMGMAMLINITPSAMASLVESNSFKHSLRKAFVFSSYYSNENICRNIKQNNPDSKISFLKNNTISVATPNETELLVFTTSECTR